MLQNQRETHLMVAFPLLLLERSGMGFPSQGSYTYGADIMSLQQDQQHLNEILEVAHDHPHALRWKVSGACRLRQLVNE